MTARSPASVGPTHHVFVDGENMPALELAWLDEPGTRLTLLLGPRQHRLDVEVVERLVKHAAVVRLVRLGQPGRNALDFTLAFELGRAAVAAPETHFHIVSKDTGFDALVTHLREQGLTIRRHEDFATLPGASAGTPAPERLAEEAWDALQRISATGRPKRKTTLLRYLGSLHGGCPVAEMEGVLVEFVERGWVAVDDRGKVAYQPVPAAPADPV